MARRLTRRTRATRHGADSLPVDREETLAVEEPLEIRVNGLALSVTMRSPGDDFDLVAGLLVSEGIIWSPEQLSSMRFCAGTDENGLQTFNVVDVELAPGVPPPDPDLARHVYTSSACGICGTTSIDAVHKAARFGPLDRTTWTPAVIGSLPGRLRERQRVFDRTGGVHAAGLFSPDGDVICVREDVGRHNAVDKVVGWALREGRLPIRDCALQVSGRLSFELVQKAHMAAIPLLTAVSAPSSLAVEHAESAGMTLIGFNRDGDFNVYTGGERVQPG